MTSSAYFGITGPGGGQLCIRALIAILGIYSMVTATAEGGGLVAMFAKNAGSMTLFTAVGLVIGSFVSGRYRHPQLHPLCQE